MPRISNVALWAVKFLGIALLDLISLYFRGFVISQYWWWFIGPLTKIPMISPLHGLGLALAVRHLTVWKPEPAREEEGKTMLERGLYTTIESAMQSLLFLGIGIAVYTLAVGVGL